MKGDFSRSTFVKKKHYSGVRLQQGRVQLDADWNEQLDIAKHLRETAIGDLVGAHGGPETGGGFEIQVDSGNDQLIITAGRYYVDGILVENEADVAVDAQPYLPGYVAPTGGGTYAAYLEVFRRHLTGLEDPEILEPALGGPDTATREQTVWQVRLQPAASCSAFVAPHAGPAPQLSARSVNPPSENQLYRIEVHQGSLDAAGAPQVPTFKWSRENGSVAARIDSPNQNEIQIVGQISQDLAGSFAAGQWVEVSDDELLLMGEPGTFGRLATVAGPILTVEAWPGAAPSLSAGAIVRRWESEPLEIDTPPVNDGFLALEDGIEIRFEDLPVATYYTGDYWLVAARASAGVLWPVDAAGDPVPQEPQGVVHHFAPLAVVERAGVWSVTSDCRRVLPSITDLEKTKVDRAGDTMTGMLILLDELEVGGNATLQSALVVEGQLTVDQSAQVGGNLTAVGLLAAQANLTVGGNAMVTGPTVLGNSLQVMQSATLGAGLAVTGDTTVEGLTATGLTVTGSVGFTGDVGVTGSVDIQGLAKSTFNGTDFFMVPSGAIIMWSGTVAPSGWAFCDGSNGTPDLRNRFIVGAGSTYSVGDTGGSATVTLAENQLPAHKHRYQDIFYSEQNGVVMVTGGLGSNTSDNDNQGHQIKRTTLDDTPVPIPSDPSDTQPRGAAHENRPPYFALAFIMKV